MIRLLSTALLLMLASAAAPAQDTLYHSGTFSVYGDSVVQGAYTAQALSRTHITSDYQSPASTHYSSTLNFKFAINGKDNEAPAGQDHQLTIIPKDGSYTSPVIKFGQEDPARFVVDTAAKYLPPNTEFTVRVDMNHVLEEFEKKGYYTTFDGEKIPESNFDGVYIAGGSEPLSWDFDNLRNNPDYKLADPDGDGIYKGTFTLNPHDPDEKTEKAWKLEHDISGYPSFRSSYKLADALYNMGLDETQMLIEADSTFRTGAKWEGVWTRDISYSVLLAYAYMEPEISRISLMKKVADGRIIQDTGSGGAWPVSSDRVVWTLAAWEIYKVTGDRDWLEQSYRIVKKSLQADLKTVYSEQFGLFRGESSFLDWREQSYPNWMDNVDISQSMNLGTNAVYYKTFDIMAEMAGLLDKPEDADYYAKYASTIKEGINEHLWNGERGYYNQFLYGRHYMNASPKSETLGEALSVLLGVAGQEKSERIVANTPMVPYGAPSFYPQIPNVPPYHNNGIWPFVQAYWNWAAAKTGNEKALKHGLASLYRPAALFLTNKENFVAGNGDFKGTQINSDRQLWSVAGNLAMVYRVMLGIRFEPDKLVLDPTVPESMKGTKTIEGFPYRDAVLNVELTGYGDSIKQMTLDGEPVSTHEIPAGLEGTHTVRIVMNNRFEDPGEMNLKENKFTLPEPRLQISNDTLSWNAIDTAKGYLVYRNGIKIVEIPENRYLIPDGRIGQYKVAAIGKDGWPSFTSEPVNHYPEGRIRQIELESVVEPDNDLDPIDYTGSGFVEITKQKNKSIEIPVSVDEPGTYLLSFRYSNGTGPWNTDNNCAIRTLMADGEKAGTVVLPQRGEGEWSNWGISNRIKLQLDKGEHTLELTWQPSNENMDGQINRALLDHLKLIRIGR